ncbi:MAG: HIT family protein [Bacilli bacterium]|nr:HIT family protein [Bacilli bacterium]
MKDVFCRIIAGEIPCTKVYEDDDVLAILDISQVTKGHTLVMPKAHYEHMLSCPADLLGKVMAVARRIGQAEVEVLGAQGVNILTNVGEAAGQSVPHFHVHVIPRYTSSEGGFLLEMKQQDTSGYDLPRLAHDISKAID